MNSTTYVKRKEAFEKGAKRYFTGKRCINGHLSERYTTNRCCIECLDEWRVKNMRKMTERSNAWQKRNHPHMRQYHKLWSARNAERWKELLHRSAVCLTSAPMAPGSRI